MTASIYSTHACSADEDASPQPAQISTNQQPSNLDNGNYFKWQHLQHQVKTAAVRLLQNILRLLHKTNLTMWIILGLILGIIVGHTASSFAVKIKPLADVFLQMISSLITQLIFSTLVMGIAAHGNDLLTVGRLAIKVLVYFEMVSTLAILLGLLLVSIARPGKGTPITPSDATLPTNSTITWDGELFKIIPKSFFAAAVDGEVLQIVFCALMFAVALCRVPSQSARQPMLDFLHSLSETMFKVTALVMNYAPVGIGCSIAATVGQNGLGVLISLSKLVGILYGTLVIFIVAVLIPIMLLTKIPVKQFFVTVWPPFLLAFTTASSESALPMAMERLEHTMGIPKQVVGFVIPTGYSFNLDGTSLYLSIAVIYCAQVMNISMPVGKQLVVMLTLMLTSKGMAAVPRASFVVLSAALANFNIPDNALTLILGVDAFMDMGRTGVNVMGNCLAACVIARWEGVYPPYGQRVDIGSRSEEHMLDNDSHEFNQQLNNTDSRNLHKHDAKACFHE